MADDDRRRITPDNVRRENLNPNIETEYELKSSILTPQTGRAPLTQDFNEYYKIKRLDEDNQTIYDNAWDGFASITSDTRISNLDPHSPEYAYVQWAMKMQLMCIQAGLPRSAALAQALALSQTEPSLAKNMAFLRTLQTVRQESQHLQIDQSSKSRNIFGKIADKIKG